MSRTVGRAWLLALCLVAAGAEGAPKRRPVVALTTLGELFIGTVFVLYEDGLVIWRPLVDGELQRTPLTARLTAVEVKRLLAEIDLAAMRKLPERLDENCAMDAPIARLRSWTRTDHASRPRADSSYPAVTQQDELALMEGRIFMSNRSEGPFALLRAFDAMVLFAHPDAKPWEGDIPGEREWAPDLFPPHPSRE